ncbi:Endonuclease MutS2 [Usitatibacter rugosus]|uniref:Endonuclease MutS2 n=2 Tax=Usitatibacter rugosus TaxID=2732067 RepID=A0A6M4GWA6_9PROT|nr:Endonuclease MutS2 [Usitatibacter rugosus]
MRGVQPVRPANRIEPYREPLPAIPAKRIEDERAVLEELSRLALDGDDVEIEEDRQFLRDALPRDILRKLRRSHWVIQQELDLHGMTSDEAALATDTFLAECVRLGVRCVRIIHGKGLRSKGKEPVLKHRIRKLLQRRDPVLAYVEPKAVDGGGGAVVVLLKG